MHDKMSGKCKGHGKACRCDDTIYRSFSRPPVTFAGHFIVHIFTDDTQMINLVVKLLIVDIFLELGRVTNLVYGQALKTSGDAFFPVILGAIFMYLFAVGGTYFLGIHMGLLAVGAYIAMAGDECARAVGMVLRWKSGKWKSKGLVEV